MFTKEEQKRIDLSVELIMSALRQEQEKNPNAIQNFFEAIKDANNALEISLIEEELSLLEEVE